MTLFQLLKPFRVAVSGTGRELKLLRPQEMQHPEGKALIHAGALPG